MERTLTFFSGAPGAPAEAPAAGVRYEDLGPLAEGGMGEVRRVRDHLLQCTVAMKLCAPDRVGSASARARFRTEATLTATLRHPGILAVHDRGERPDGVLWYTMEIVSGRTLAEHLRTTERLRDRVAAVERACEALAYAHREGVVHRDLKPDNVMLDEFGGVRIIDWGIAARVGDPPEPGLGTPGWVAPEQARGCAPDPSADVYGLGSLLHLAITGDGVRRGPSAELWRLVQEQPPDVFAEVPPGVPPALAAACRAAMSPDPAGRPTAGALAAALSAWLEADARAAAADRVFAEVAREAPLHEARRRQIDELRAIARTRLAELPTHASPEDKGPAWDLEDRAAELERELTVSEAGWLQSTGAVFELVPDHEGAHQLLADHHAAELLRAEAAGNHRDALRSELHLRRHDRGRHAALLAGDGAVTLVTDPPGAEVELLRVVERGRRLVEEPAGHLGRTPLREARLPRGSWVLVLRAPGRATVRYPVHLARGGAWDAVRPGDLGPTPIHLPEAGAWGPDDCHVPAGWFVSGGDPLALDGLPRRAWWVDGFVMRRFPVTNQDYLVFLNDLVATGREALAEACSPCDPSIGLTLYDRAPDGGFAFRVGRGQEPRLLDEPVTFVDAACARAYAAWEAERTGQPWRLPDDLEWEKAARGVDARSFPWGNHLDPVWALMQLSHRGPPLRAAVSGFPVDESVYGIRGLGGNVRDWCENAYRRGGPEAGRLVVTREPAAADVPHQLIRGGSFGSSADLCRAATRLVWNPTARGSVVGLRLVRSHFPRQ